MRISTVITAAAVSLSATTAPALAAEGVGEIMAVIDSASVSGQVGERTLAVGSKVFVGDLVATDAVGEAQLLFSDGTRMVVGSNSSLMIDEFQFRGNATENATENQFAVSALGGAFRFMSGDSGDRGYSIRTPSATIAVRGTAFDFTVTDETKLVLLQGEATLCNEGGDCATVATPCGLLQTDTGQDVEEIEAGNRRVQETREHFPYMTSQSSLLEGFQIVGHGCTAGPGGLAESALDAQAIRKAAPVVLGAAGIAAIAAAALAASSSSSTTSTIDTNNGTN